MVLRQFIKRNVIMYFRDKTSVFFSLLSTLIVLALMVSFLGNANVDSTLKALGDSKELSKMHASCLITIWTLAGIIVVNAVSITMTLVGNMVRDEETKRLDGFFASPVNRGIYAIGYVTASIVVAFIMCMITFVAAEVYIYSIGGSIVSLVTLIKVLVVVIAIIFSSSAFVFLCATCIHTNSAFSGLTTVLGTLIGFLAAIYVPFGSMPKTLQSVLKFIPAYQGSSALRELLTCKEIDWFAAEAQVSEGYREYMGIVVNISGHNVTLMGKIIYMFATGVVLMLVSTMVLAARKRD